MATSDRQTFNTDCEILRCFPLILLKLCFSDIDLSTKTCGKKDENELIMCWFCAIILQQQIMITATIFGTGTVASIKQE